MFSMTRIMSVVILCYGFGHIIGVEQCIDLSKKTKSSDYKTDFYNITGRSYLEAKEIAIDCFKHNVSLFTATEKKELREILQLMQQRNRARRMAQERIIGRECSDYESFIYRTKEKEVAGLNCLLNLKWQHCIERHEKWSIMHRNLALCDILALLTRDKKAFKRLAQLL